METQTKAEKTEGEKFVEYLHEQLEDLQTLQLNMTTKLKSMLELIQSQTLDNCEMVDIGFHCRELSNTLEDIAKECRAKLRLVSKVLCAKVVQESMGEDHIPRQHGRYATGQPKLRECPGIPKQGTEAYSALCKYFHIPEEVENSGVVNWHFNSLAELITQLREDGKNPPDGILKTFTEFLVEYRRKR